MGFLCPVDQFPDSGTTGIWGQTCCGSGGGGGGEEGGGGGGEVLGLCTRGGGRGAGLGVV